MSEPRYDIFFKGECLDEKISTEVLQQRFAKAFKLDLTKIAPFFSGNATALKKNQTRTDTLKFKKALESLGAKVYVRNAGIGFDATQTPTARPQADKAASTETATVHTKTQQPVVEDGYTILPVGSNLLDASEKTASPELYIDLSHIELSDKDSLEDLIEEVETPELPILSHLSAAEAGADILEGYEAVEIPLPQADISHLALDQAGEDLLKPDERQKNEQVAPNTEHISIAENDDFLAPKKPETPPAPDVSHISLSD